MQNIQPNFFPCMQEELPHETCNSAIKWRIICEELASTLGHVTAMAARLALLLQEAAKNG